MIYNGQEVGYPNRLEFFSRTPIDWRAADPAVLAEYKKLVGFYHNSEAVRKGVLASYSSEDVVAFTKTLGSERVLVLANLRNEAVNYAPPANLAQSQWKNAFDDSSVKIGSQIGLQPFEYLVLKNQ